MHMCLIFLLKYKEEICKKLKYLYLQIDQYGIYLIIFSSLLLTRSFKKYLNLQILYPCLCFKRSMMGGAVHIKLFSKKV